MLFTIIIFFLVLSVLVFAHELGHFYTARRFGVKAEEFGFGLPPRIFGFYKNNEGKWVKVWGAKDVIDAPKTVYSLNWLPIGGFVKIRGENGDSNEKDSFTQKKIWQRAVMLSAGVSMNMILAIIFFIICLAIGMPQSLDGISSKAHISDRQIEIMSVLPGSPAEKAGIKAGDVIQKINDNNFNNYADLQTYVDKNTGKDLTYKLKRGDKEVVQKVKPEIIKETGKGGIGVAILETGMVRYPWYLAIWEGIKMTFLITWAIIVAFSDLIKNLIIGHGLNAELAGPIGIAAMTGQFARLGLVRLMQFVAMLSINLAILNFLPFPALDGGRVLFLLIEKIKGKPVKREIEGIIHTIGFALLMALVILVTYKDIARLQFVKNLFSNLF